MLRIGLTGPSGAGKSRICQYLARQGAAIVDGDKIAREICGQGSPVLPLLAARFGADILSPEGILDRRLLASRAFADDAGREALNAITHPAILAEFDRRLRALEPTTALAVIDAAALIESGYTRTCDCLVAVTAPYDTRLQRIMARDGIDEAAARRRMDAQPPAAFYTDPADYVVENAGDACQLESACDALHRFLFTRLQQKLGLGENAR